MSSSLLYITSLESSKLKPLSASSTSDEFNSVFLLSGFTFELSGDFTGSSGVFAGSSAFWAGVSTFWVWGLPSVFGTGVSGCGVSTFGSLFSFPIAFEVSSAIYEAFSLLRPAPLNKFPILFLFAIKIPAIAILATAAAATL